MKLTKKEWFENNQYDTKTNKIIAKSNSLHSKNDCEPRMIYNSAKIRGRRNNISKSY